MRIMLQHIRDGLKINQEEIAERIGCSVSMVSRWERGCSNIPSERLPELARAYRCSVSDIFLDDEISTFAIQDRIPIIAKIAAGSWIEFGKDGSETKYFIGRSDSTCDSSDRFGVLLQDDCMDEIYPIGSLLECVSSKIYEQIPHGKKVVGTTVHNRNKTEAWVKEIQMDGGIFHLISRSKSTRHQKTITICDTEQNKKLHRILGVVVACTMYE